MFKRLLSAGGNPLWSEVAGPVPWWPGSQARLERRLADLQLRGRLLASYAHTLSSPQTIRFILRWTEGVDGIVSIGAGTGYWEGLLAARGVRVAAFDIAPPDRRTNVYHTLAGAGGHWMPTVIFAPIQEGGANKAAEYPSYALFLSWPPPGPMAADALKAFRGRRFIYMGDRRWNATPDFFAQLSADWRLVATHIPVRWTGTHDVVEVYERK